LRIAVPSKKPGGLKSEVEPHFGRAACYTLVDIEDGRIKDVAVVQQPQGEHRPGVVPRLLKRHGVDVVLVYGMGPRAAQMLEAMGIKVVGGAMGLVEDAVHGFLSGSLSGGPKRLK